jgi:serine/threonine protein kinase
VTIADARIASKYVAVARERAEARFVIEYRQLVSSDSMEAFQSAFSQYEMARSDIVIGAELGRGQSGVVFVGAMAKGYDVAVKARLDAGDTAVGESAVTGDEALVLEALLLQGLQHAGIVKLVAVVTLTAPVMVCTELMPNGDLRNFLRSCRSATTPAKMGEPKKLPSSRRIDGPVLIAIAARLSSAMAYLETQSIVHRDVAARNVLVGAKASDVKMADLGAARNVHRTSESSYSGVYVAKAEHNPARWMPLEALREAKFSVKSDVFSFGVLLWEILTLGQTPWGAFPVQEFVAALDRGDRLQFTAVLATQQQHSASSESSSEAEHSTHDTVQFPSTTDLHLAKKISAIAVRCWMANPDKRPHFHQLAAEFAIHQTVMLAEAERTGRTLPAEEAARHETTGSHTTGHKRASSNGSAGLRATSNSSGCTNRTLDCEGYVTDDFASAVPCLDADGYVADLNDHVRPARDAEGAFADGSMRPRQNGCGTDGEAKIRHSIDTDGYVANGEVRTRHSIDTDGYVADGDVRIRHSVETKGCVTDGEVSAMPSPNGVAHGAFAANELFGMQEATSRARMPSVYEGFSGGLKTGDNDENSRVRLAPSALTSQPLENTEIEPVPTQGWASASNAKPSSLYLRSVQNGHADETRL